ncbi:MAG: hypothetical protein LBG57_09265, partial [Treponema sp.]|nr:hypothetical protein [Treponema sp.]
ITAASPGATLTLYANEVLPVITLNKSITLIGDSTEKTLSLGANGNMFNITAGTLTLDNYVTLQGRSTNNSPVVNVASGGSLVMKSGSKITGNSTTGTGTGGVRVQGGSFTMEGGTISNNIGSNVSDTGGGVRVDSGSFSMSGGTISGNYCGNDGGGVWVNSGSFTMTGGTISGNTSRNGGGGVWVNSSGSFTMTGGIISGNTSQGTAGGSGGGGVSPVGNNSFTKSGGGIIYGNDVNDPLRNIDSTGRGHAVFRYSNGPHRHATLWEADNISTSNLSSPPWDQ